jgi:hypothetical protein
MLGRCPGTSSAANGATISAAAAIVPATTPIGSTSVIARFEYHAPSA